jgi:hypothetical protein
MPAPRNSLLNELTTLHPDALTKRLVDLFDVNITEPDTEVLSALLKSELEKITQEKLVQSQGGGNNVPSI